MEPERTEKRATMARKLLEVGQPPSVPAKLSLDEIKQRLRSIREDSRDNNAELVKQFQATLAARYPDVKVTLAADGTGAADYIDSISGTTRTLSVNNSGIVAQELKPELAARGYNVINSYIDEFDAKEKKIQDYWALPRFPDGDVRGTFEVVYKMKGTDGHDQAETKDYIALLGVNAAAADDGTVFFMQHFHNIHTDLSHARKAVLVIGLDKVVRSHDDAAFQTECMGIFGIENLLLSINPKREIHTSVADLDLPVVEDGKELHIIILDNGRSAWRDGAFRELFLCIGCRRCNKHCPIRHSFTVDYLWTPRNYLTQFVLGKSHSIDICLHCESCRVECPLNLDLPHMMWEMKTEYLKSHSRSLSHRIIGTPEMLAKLGTLFAPIANFAMGIKPVRVVMEAVTGIDRRTALPKFHFRTFRKRMKNDD